MAVFHGKTEEVLDMTSRVGTVRCPLGYLQFFFLPGSPAMSCPRHVVSFVACDHR
jgi:hypothetical protein